MQNIQETLAKLKTEGSQDQTQDQDKVQHTPEVNIEGAPELGNTPSKEVKPKKFQHYTSSRQALRMITVTGKPIVFCNYRFITADQDVIDYLDHEIARGLNIVEKGELLDHDESDPMAILRRKILQEAIEKGEVQAVQSSTGVVTAG